MKQKIQAWWKNVSAQDVMWWAAIFLATMLGTAVSTAIFNWGMSAYGELGVLARLAISLAATAAYALVVVAIFYAFFPETKSALRQIWRR